MQRRTIIHVDMDAFSAAFEVRDNPDLGGKPLIVGAHTDERGLSQRAATRRVNVEYVSLDESYLEVTGSQKLFGGAGRLPVG